MNAANLIQLARAKKRDSVLGFLKLAFDDFAYPVYLFGSYATGQFHGYSDVDLVIIAPETLAKKVYHQACNKMTGLGVNYDILITPSINRLDSSIVSSLQAVSATASASPKAPALGAIPPASMLSKDPVLPLQTGASPFRHQRGVTLVELMIAMLLGLFLIGGLLQIFISSKQTYRMQEGLSRVQENGRFAMDFITRDIRMAGFIGCASLRRDDDHDGVDDFPNSQLKQLVNPESNYLYLFKTFIQGFEATSATEWTPLIGANDMDDNDMTTINNPSPGSDIITIRRADEQGFILAASMSDLFSPLSLLNATANNFKAAGFVKSNGNNNFAIAVISDCEKADVFQISSIAGSNLNHTVVCNTSGSGCPTPDNSSSNLTKAYLQGAQVFPINTITYYVSLNPGNNFSLYRRIGTNSAEELVEGVEKMEILYGVDIEFDGTVNFYVNAKEVSDANNWAKVVSVRISLLLATIDDNLTAQTVDPFSFNGQNTPADRRLRRIFTSTVAVRNRLP